MESHLVKIRDEMPSSTAVRDWLNGERGEPNNGWSLIEDLLRNGVLRSRQLNLSLVQAFRAVMPERGTTGQVRKDSSHLSWLYQLVGYDHDLRNLAEAAALAGVTDPVAEAGRVAFDKNYAPEHVWAFHAEHPLQLNEALARDHSWREPDRDDGLRVLGMFPTLPPTFLPLVREIATSDVAEQRQAQQLLERQPDVLDIAAEALKNDDAQTRAIAARWIGQISDTAGIDTLRRSLAEEEHEGTRTAVLQALRALGADISVDLTPQVLAEAATRQRLELPQKLTWFPFDDLPACSWADGTLVDPQIVRWWVVRAFTLNDPASAEIGLYLSLMDTPSQQALGTFVLDAWVARDTEPSPDPAKPDGYRGNAVKEKGLLALTVAAPGHHVTTVFDEYAAAHGWRRYPDGKKYARRAAQLEAMLTAAAENPSALPLVLAVADKFGQKPVKETAAALVGKVAERHGWTADVLGDRTVPTAGFDSTGTLRLDYGPRAFVGRVAQTKSGAFTIALSGPDGKTVRSLPAPAASDDAAAAEAAREQYAQSKKRLTQVAKAQTARLSQAMHVQRTWTTRDWHDLFTHPIVRHLMTALVWTCRSGQTSVEFRPTSAGELLAGDDTAVVLPDDAQISLAHSAIIAADQTAHWQEHLADYEIRPPFSQFSALTPPPVDPDATSIDDHLGWLSDTTAIRQHAVRRGFPRGREYYAHFYEYEKAIPGTDISVIIEFTGSYVRAYTTEQHSTAAVERLTFRRCGTTMKISEVPPIILAEAYDDYVYVAEAGTFDPDWETTCVYWFV
ncbi:MAG: DUF4132 domain-containing protein [Micrococcales bacterium]|nr:DUF4132 domain-containing protein [Micrococcales bacterium]